MCFCSVFHGHCVSQVIVTFKREKKAGDHDVVQFFNILFNRIFRLLKFSQHNRNFYDPAGAHSIKQYNLQVRKLIFETGKSAGSDSFFCEI